MELAALGGGGMAGVNREDLASGGGAHGDRGLFTVHVRLPDGQTTTLQIPAAPPAAALPGVTQVQMADGRTLQLPAAVMAQLLAAHSRGQPVVLDISGSIGGGSGGGGGGGGGAASAAGMLGAIYPDGLGGFTMAGMPPGANREYAPGPGGGMVMMPVLVASGQPMLLLDASGQPMLLHANSMAMHAAMAMGGAGGFYASGGGDGAPPPGSGHWMAAGDPPPRRVTLDLRRVTTEHASVLVTLPQSGTVADFVASLVARFSLATDRPVSASIAGGASLPHDEPLCVLRDGDRLALVHRDSSAAAVATKRPHTRGKRGSGKGARAGREAPVGGAAGAAAAAAPPPAAAPAAVATKRPRDGSGSGGAAGSKRVRVAGAVAAAPPPTLEPLGDHSTLAVGDVIRWSTVALMGMAPQVSAPAFGRVSSVVDVDGASVAAAAWPRIALVRAAHIAAAAAAVTGRERGGPSVVEIAMDELVEAVRLTPCAGGSRDAGAAGEAGVAGGVAAAATSPPRPLLWHPTSPPPPPALGGAEPLAANTAPVPELKLDSAAAGSGTAGAVSAAAAVQQPPLHGDDRRRRAAQAKMGLGGLVGRLLAQPPPHR